jgi:hypothetical protein
MPAVTRGNSKRGASSKRRAPASSDVVDVSTLRLMSYSVHGGLNYVPAQLPPPY